MEKKCLHPSEKRCAACLSKGTVCENFVAEEIGTVINENCDRRSLPPLWHSASIEEFDEEKNSFGYIPIEDIEDEESLDFVRRLDDYSPYVKKSAHSSGGRRRILYVHHPIFLSFCSI